MSDSFTETTRISWFTRIKNALGGIVMGIIFLIGSIVLLFWNEGRAVKTATALKEGAGLVRTIDPSSPPGDAAGKLVHFSGALQPSGVPQDGLFSGVTAQEGAIRLVRKVEMYQWSESKKTKTVDKLGGGQEKVTTYSYRKTWSEREIDSSRFKRSGGRSNPAMPVRSETFGVESGSVGKITLAGSQFSDLGEDQIIPPDSRILNIVKARFSDGRIIDYSGEVISIRSRKDSSAIGDLRIRFLSGDADVISVVGQLNGNRIGAFTASNGRKISMFQAGTADAKQMFDDALTTNTLWTWGLRLAGFVIMLLGFKMIFSVVSVLGSIIPFVGDVFRFATGLAAFALAAVLSTVIIGTAWFYYRPLLSIGIIVVGLAIAFAAFYFGKSRVRGQVEEGAA